MLLIKTNKMMLGLQSNFFRFPMILRKVNTSFHKGMCKPRTPPVFPDDNPANGWLYVLHIRRKQPCISGQPFLIGAEYMNCIVIMTINLMIRTILLHDEYINTQLQHFIYFMTA